MKNKSNYNEYIDKTNKRALKKSQLIAQEIREQAYGLYSDDLILM